MYRSKSLKYAILVFSFGIIASICIGLGIHEKRSLQNEKLACAVEELGQDDFQFCLWDMENSAEASSVFIKWWYQPENNIYYLFLPSQVHCDLVFLFNLHESVQLDGQAVKVGEKSALIEGTHKLVVEAGQEYELMVMQSDNIASLFIETDGKNIDAVRESKDNIATGEFVLLDELGKVNCSGVIEEFRGRGNISYDAYSKKPFAIKTAEKIAPLGMEFSRKWTLLANADDDTLLRNQLVMEMGRRIDMAYVPDMEYVDLYVDGEYQGNYQLAERVEIASGRVDIRDLEKEIETLNMDVDFTALEQTETENERFPSLKWTSIDTKSTDITSGYLLELDMIYRYNAEISGFTSSRNQPVVVQEPKYVSEAQLMYLANLYQDFEDALATADGYNETAGKYYYDYMDMDSFAKKYLIEEMSKNLDASLTSFFLYIPQKDGKFYAGPLWDYDRTFGTPFERGGIDLKDPNGFYASEDVYFEQADVNLMYLLCQHEDFQEKYKEIYFNQLRGVMLDLEENFILENASRVEASAVMNAIRWHDSDAGMNIEDNRALFVQKNEDVRNFIIERLHFLDNAWGENP